MFLTVDLEAETAAPCSVRHEADSEPNEKQYLANTVSAEGIVS